MALQFWGRWALSTKWGYNFFKSCVLYIFASLFFKYKRSFGKLGKMFLFHFKCYFGSRENQSSEFYMFKFHYVIKCLSTKQRNTFYWITWEVKSLLMRFGKFMSCCKRKTFIKKFYKNCDLKSSCWAFCVYKELSTASIGKWNFRINLLILDM